MLASSKLGHAPDLSKEDPRIVARCGTGDEVKRIDDHGAPRVPQSFLVARRLVEAGARVVTVNGSKRDWHGGKGNEIFKREHEDFPIFDRVVTALLFAFSLIQLQSASAEPHHKVVPGWPILTNPQSLGQCVGVAVDPNNRVFVFHRSGRTWSNPAPAEPIPADTVSVFDGATGALIDSWGAGRFLLPHGLSIDSRGKVWLTDVGLHQVFQFTPEGKELLVLGEARVPGADKAHFDLPTDVAVLPDGSFYVSDGYRNTRVVKFDAAGHYDFEWGTKGSGPGQFDLPHGLTLDVAGRVYVCDRSNSRIQVFDARGSFLSQWKGPRMGRPYGIGTAPDGHLFVVDGGNPADPAERQGKVVKLDPAGKVIDTFSGPGFAPGRLQLGHDVALGPDGAVYVSEAAGKRVQKFVTAGE